jgi:hypothetical protein
VLVRSNHVPQHSCGRLCLDKIVNQIDKTTEQTNSDIVMTKLEIFYFFASQTASAVVVNKINLEVFLAVKESRDDKMGLMKSS